MGQIVNRMRNRWIHKTSITDINEFNSNVNYCYINNVIEKRELTRPKFSIFTTCYKSYEKINRAYGGMKSQTLRDWEWILLDDSPEDEHFDFLRKLAKEDKRIRQNLKPFFDGIRNHKDLWKSPKNISTDFHFIMKNSAI